MRLEHLTVYPAVPSSAPPILLVHGAWHGAWCWAEHVLPYIAAQGWEAHALSLRGHGSSEGRVRWASALDYVADVAQVAATLRTPPVLVGHSMGGYIVQKYLETHSAPAGVLLGSVPHFGSLPFLLRQIVEQPLAVLRIGYTLDLRQLLATTAQARRALFSADLPDDLVARYHARTGSESVRIALDTGFFNLPRPRRVKAPLLVMGAANDRIFPAREVEATARAYGTQAVIFPDMAHDMMLERGWQAVADRLLGWLREQGL
jgi:pimeloyl-ACP methyl ester carboxylesterase